MKKILFILITLVAFASFGKELIGKVIKVSDGDTITVLDSNNKKRKVRLDRIDAPESKQSFGIKSRNYLAKLIENKKATIQYKKVDRYKRILGIVKLDDMDVNLHMVSTGHAWHYSHYDKTLSYKDAQNNAKQKKLGLWKESNPIEPYLFRKQNKSKSKRR
jgi:endonuclease YncB( thermonuclease family)